MPVSTSRSSPLIESRTRPRITPPNDLYNHSLAWYLLVLPSFDPVARIDLSALTSNLREVRRLVGARVKILAMVKADAYGHGACGVVERLASLDVQRFGVATLDEAEEISSFRGPIPCVVFGGIAADEAARAVALGAEVVTESRAVVEALGACARASGGTVPIHIKVDTGMHRLGVASEDVGAFAAAVANTPGVSPVALCSHFAMAESVATTVTDGQLERLAAAREACASRGLRLEAHLANSAAVITRPTAHLDMVRPGLMLYGLYPDEALRKLTELAPVMTLEACVVRVASVGPGEGIGYGHTFRAPKPMRIATLRCGYADGYPRALSNCGEVRIGDVLAPVVGRVCMDHTMVDVTALPDVEPGMRATMWGRNLATESVAEKANTIAYELVARVGRRVARRLQG
jgi:alanine racemase